MNEFFGFTWAHGSYMYTVFGVIAGAGILLWLIYCQLRRADLLGFSQRPQLFKNFSRSKKFVKAALMIVSLLLLWTGLMRPQKNDEEHTIVTQERDFIFALDISCSMLAKDMEGDTVDRLTFAKKKIRSLVTSLGTDRVSLILFAQSAFVYCPLTSDRASFIALLDTIDTKMTALGSTSIASALEKALELFERVPERKSKVLVLFTDGEDFSPDLAALRARAHKAGVLIFTVGIGTTTGAPIPLYDENDQLTGFQKDTDGSIVITRLDEKILEHMARESGGFYQTATASNADIVALRRQLESFEKESTGERTMHLKKEFFNYLAAVAGTCLLIEWLL